MAGFNQFTIAGNVGRDPEQRVTKGGAVTLSFSVGVNDKGKDSDTTWVEVTLWDRLAESVGPYIHKGKQVLVSGRAGSRAYIGKQNGEAVPVLTLSASTIQLLGSRDGGESRQSAPARDSYGIGDLGPPLQMDDAEELSPGRAF